MIKECFIELKDKKIIEDHLSPYWGESFSNRIDDLLLCEEEQLIYALGSYNGIIIGKYTIQYEGGVGFRVRNLDEHVSGRAFECNRMEKVLNDKYKKLNKSFEKTTDNFTLIYASIINDNLKYVQIFDAMPTDFKKVWSEKLDLLNQRWCNELYVKFDNKMTPGCLIYGDDIEKGKRIVEDVYKELNFGKIKIKIAYGVGEVDVINQESVHFCYGPVFIKVGRTLDEIEQQGIYYVE